MHTMVAFKNGVDEESIKFDTLLNQKKFQFRWAKAYFPHSPTSIINFGAPILATYCVIRIVLRNFRRKKFSLTKFSAVENFWPPKNSQKSWKCRIFSVQMVLYRCFQGSYGLGD